MSFFHHDKRSIMCRINIFLIFVKMYICNSVQVKTKPYLCLGKSDYWRPCMHYIVLQSVSCVPCKKYFQKLYHASLRFDGSLTFTESHNKLWSLVKTTMGLKEIHAKTENCSSYLYRKGSQSNQNYIYID